MALQGSRSVGSHPNLQIYFAKKLYLIYFTFEACRSIHSVLVTPVCDSGSEMELMSCVHEIHQNLCAIPGLNIQP